MSSLSLPLTRPSVLGARRTAFGQIVRNEARLVRRQPTNMIGSIEASWDHRSQECLTNAEEPRVAVGAQTHDQPNQAALRYNDMNAASIPSPLTYSSFKVAAMTG
jgi:hypothetical protein